MRLRAIALTALTAGCSGRIPVGSVSSAIIGGTIDAADPAVVILYVTVPGKAGGELCTGEVISPHVVLTAAHCTGGEDPSVADAVWRVYPGSDFSQATTATMLPVREAHFNPQFDINNLAAGNDVGVAILQDAIAVTPLPLNRAPLDETADGKTVRFVGYGLDNSAAQSGAGVKRQTTTTLSDHSALLLHFSDGTHETCNGDSGGPALLTIDGGEKIIGLTSYGDPNCDQGGYDTRVDAMLSFIDPFVQANDPGSAATAPPDMTLAPSPSPSPPVPSGGTQSPPTPPAATSPPSGSEAGAVGASCSGDAQCQSGVCGLDNHGAYVCLAAGASDGNGDSSGSGAVGGCQLSGPAGDGQWGLATILLLGLALKLRRGRARARR